MAKAIFFANDLMHIIDGFFLLSTGKPHVALKPYHVRFDQIITIDSRHKDRLMLYRVWRLFHRILSLLHRDTPYINGLV